MERCCSNRRVDLADLVHANHPLKPFPAQQGQGKDADTTRQKGSELDAKIAPQGVVIASEFTIGLPWLLVAFTAMTVHGILSLQVAAFLLFLVVLWLPRVRVALMPRKARRAVAHRVALEQFAIRGIARKQERSGILFFVSLAERYARVVADDTIAARVPQSEWQVVIDAVVAHMRNGRLADGFVTAINLCGDKLARHYPRTETNRDELPDRIYLI